MLGMGKSKPQKPGNSIWVTDALFQAMYYCQVAPKLAQIKKKS